MIVKVRKKLNVSGSDGDLLQSNREYTVYAVLFEKEVSFLLSDDSIFSFPFFVSEKAVDIVDAGVSKHWLYSPAAKSSEKHSSRGAMFSFSEMVLDRYFYENLVDGLDEAKLIWIHAKHAMDLENNGQISADHVH